MPASPAPPDALMLLHSTCPHCPGVLESLARLVKEGTVGRLEVVNLQVHPEIARELGARAVPWCRLGLFELEGAHTLDELRHWAERAGSETGMSEYIDHRLREGALNKVEKLLGQQPSYLKALLPLLSDPETAIQTRVGIGALLETREGRPELAEYLLEPLRELTDHADHRVRTDACHYLGLTHDRRARETLKKVAEQDDNPDAREAARESLDQIAGEEPG